MSTKRTSTVLRGNSGPQLTISQLAFLVADIARAENASSMSTTLDGLGTVADEIKKETASQNINLNDPEVSVEVRRVTYDEHAAAFVDVNYGGGGEAPDFFRFVYVVSDGKYIGNAGDVGS